MRRGVRYAFCAIIVLASSGCARNSATSDVAATSQLTRDLEQVRAATRPFQSLDAAVAAGYAREVAACIVHEHHGAMGFHHVNRTYMDEQAEIERPEILLYERMADGSYKLNGVEYIIPYRSWPRDSVAPTLMGQTLKQEDNLKYWYLHAWVWSDNPGGVFADFNERVQCPAESRRVYVPSGE